MKKTIPILMAVAALILLGSTTPSNAQSVGYQPTGSDGITASPKFRQFLNSQGAPMDKTASKAVPSNKSVGYQATGDDGITASPKYRQVLTEEYAQVDAQLNNPQVASTKSVGYRATGDDGITASPKMRQFLDEQARGATQMAPLK